MTGAVLLIGLVVECYTILRIGRLLTLHVFLGMLLLGPVVLKPDRSSTSRASAPAVRRRPRAPVPRRARAICAQ
jgi:hypothetical protein